jgi:hypothetical protein
LGCDGYYGDSSLAGCDASGYPGRLRTLTEVEQPIRNGRTMFIVMSETAGGPERVALATRPGTATVVHSDLRAVSRTSKGLRGGCGR